MSRASAVGRGEAEGRGHPGASVVLAPPFGAALELVERSRWGTASLLVALATVAAMEVRLDALWAAAGA